MRDVHELRKILATYVPSRQNGAGLSRGGISQVFQCYYTLFICTVTLFFFIDMPLLNYAKIKAKQSLNNVKISLLCFWHVFVPIDLLIFSGFGKHEIQANLQISVIIWLLWLLFHKPNFNLFVIIHAVSLF